LPFKANFLRLVRTLRAQAHLIKDLLEENYAFVLTSKLQSDPIERRFSQYRQMNGGNFLVSLNEVTNSEKILLCRSLIKQQINFWEEPELVSTSGPNFSTLEELLQEMSSCLQNFLKLRYHMKAKRFHFSLLDILPKS